MIDHTRPNDFITHVLLCSVCAGTQAVCMSRNRVREWSTNCRDERATHAIAQQRVCDRKQAAIRRKFMAKHRMGTKETITARIAVENGLQFAKLDIRER